MVFGFLLRGVLMLLPRPLWFGVCYSVVSSHQPINHCTAGFATSGGEMALPGLIKGNNLQGAKNFLLVRFNICIRTSNFHILTCFEAQDLGSMIWHGTISCICLSILCFYLRIFEFEDNFQNYAYGLFILCSLWGIGSMASGFLLCSPPSNFWNMKDLGKCQNYNTYLLVTSILEIVLTSAILALPIKPILRLNLDLRTQLTILGIFLLGGLYVPSLHNFGLCCSTF